MKRNVDPALRAVAIYAILVLGVNILLAAMQFADHFSWGGMLVVMLINPIANLIVAVVGAMILAGAGEMASLLLCWIVPLSVGVVMYFLQFHVPHAIWESLPR